MRGIVGTLEELDCRPDRYVVVEPDEAEDESISQRFVAVIQLDVSPEPNDPVAERHQVFRIQRNEMWHKVRATVLAGLFLEEVDELIRDFW